MSERANRVLTQLDPVEYHGIKRLSSSGIKQLLRSPAHYIAWRDSPREATPAMILGTVVHMMVLEPHRVDDEIVVKPADAPDRRSAAGKAWHTDFEARCAGKLVISDDMLIRATGAAEAVRLHPATRGLLRDDGRIETSLLWREPRHEVLCKARPDYISRDGGYIVDVKTAMDASPEAFRKALWNFRYDIQAAFYMTGYAQATNEPEPHSFAWCVVETEAPFGVAWYRMALSDLRVALDDIAFGLETYANCDRAERWPSYPEIVQDIKLPPLASKQTNQMKDY